MKTAGKSPFGRSSQQRGHLVLMSLVLSVLENLKNQQDGVNQIGYTSQCRFTWSDLLTTSIHCQTHKFWNREYSIKHKMYSTIILWANFYMKREITSYGVAYSAKFVTSISYRTRKWSNCSHWILQSTRRLRCRHSTLIAWKSGKCFHIGMGWMLNRDLVGQSESLKCIVTKVVINSLSCIYN